jgi:hypothetical protein
MSIERFAASILGCIVLITGTHKETRNE